MITAMGGATDVRMMRARASPETTHTTSNPPSQMSVGYSSLCYGAADHPAFIWDLAMPESTATCGWRPSLRRAVKAAPYNSQVPSHPQAHEQEQDTDRKDKTIQGTSHVRIVPTDCQKLRLVKITDAPYERTGWALLLG